MKIKKSKRTIKPASGSKAKARAGLTTTIKRSAETIEEAYNLLKDYAPAPVKNLQAIIQEAAPLLADLPLNSDGVPIIEDGSPQRYAECAIASAKSAMNQIEKNNIILAVRDAMDAKHYYLMMWFALNWEPITARAVAQTLKPPTTKNKRKRWAVSIADDLIRQRYRNFPDAWDSISEDDGNRYDGFEVYRNGEDLVAEKSGKKEVLPKDSFRTGYYQRQKNQK